MVAMGSVWDRTMAVVAGRGAMLAGIAAATILLPMIVRDAFVAYATPGAVGVGAIGALLMLLMLVLTIWGQLAIIAAASDPATLRGDAFRIATNRLLPAIGVSLVLGIAFMIALIPAFAMVAGAGLDFKAMATGQSPSMAGVNGGLLAGALLYGLVWTLALLWVGAKLVIWQPVLVNERNGLHSVARSWRLTNGVVWRIIGVMILFAIVLIVAVSAAQFVTGTIFRLILGADNIATAVLLAAIAAAVVSTALTTLAIVFTTQLYAVLAGARADGTNPASL